MTHSDLEWWAVVLYNLVHVTFTLHSGPGLAVNLGQLIFTASDTSQGSIDLPDLHTIGRWWYKTF